MTTVKITELSDIGANLTTSTVVPVVNMAGVPVTQKTNIGNIANIILEGAGVDYPEASVALLAQTVSNAAQPNITSTGTLTNLTVSGNVAVNGNITSNGTAYLGNISTTGSASITTLSVGATANLGAVGNVTITGGTAGQVLSTNGNGVLSWASDATSYGNSNVVTLLSAFGSNTITTTGNVSVGNITANNLGNISNINLDGNVSNLLTGTGTYVAIPVVPTVGNIATINLTGSNSNVLYGNGVFAAVAGGGNVSELVNGNNSFVLDGDGNVVFEGNVAGQAVDRGLVWDYGANANGVNSTVVQNNGGLSVRAWTENGGSGANGYSAPVNIITNQDANTKQWRFEGDGNLTVPTGSINSINSGGDLAAYLTLTPELGFAKLSGRSDAANVGYTSTSWSNATYTGTQVTFTNAPDLVNFFNNNSFNDGVNQLFSINGEEPVPFTGYSTGVGNTVVVDTSVTADPDPTTVTSINFYSQLESYVAVDYGGGELNINATGLTILIDNDQTEGPDIVLRSGDDITLQAKNMSLGSELEGGDINLNAGDGASDDGLGNTASTGGDIIIDAGLGGDGNSSSGGTGGFTRIRGGTGGTAGVTNLAGGGGYVEIAGGDGGNDTGNTQLGASGGDVNIYGGDTTREGFNGASVYLTSGAGGPNAFAGSVNISTPSSDSGSGGLWQFDGAGDINIPPNATSTTSGRIQSANGYPTMLAYGTGSHGGPELTWTNTDNVNDLGNANVLRNTMYINESGLWVGMNENLVANTFAGTWNFTPNGTIIFPTLEVDLHNGGVQTGQVLQFGNSTQQAIITGPTPDANVNAQRLIVQGQRGNGELSEGGDVYVWAGDADTNGGDIKIYAGDADNVSAGSGGYINLAGGDGFDNGGDITLNGGYSANGFGGQISIIGGSSGNGNSNYGNVSIVSRASTWMFDNAGKLTFPGTPRIDTDANNFEVQAAEAINFEANTVVNIYTDAGNNAYQWQFGDDGNLTLPGNTFAVNYANGAQVPLGGGGNTGNVTFDDNIVIGTGDEFGFSGLYLAVGPDSIANSAVQYLRVRGGDAPTHIHLDTGNNQAYDQYFGDDGKFVRLDSGDFGNVTIGTQNPGNSFNWSFTSDGNLILADGNSVIQSIANSSLDPTLPNVSTMVFTPDSGYSSQSLVLDPTAPGHIHLRSPGANIDEPYANIFLGGETSSFEVGYYNGAVPNLFIHSGNNTWTFDNGGNLTLPTGGEIIVSGGIVGGGASPAPYISGFDSIGALEFTNGTSNVTVNSNSNLWTFDSTGNLTLPANAFAINYANGTQVSLGGGNVTWAQIEDKDGNSGPTLIALGQNAGFDGQGNAAIAIGKNAGAGGQGASSITIGEDAGGNTTQSSAAIAIGSSAGYDAQGLQAVAIGLYAGTNTQGQYSVAIGSSAGATSQGQESVAVGVNSGSTAQGIGAVSIGASSGASSQGNTSVAIGTSSGALSQGANAVAIGYLAGYQSQGNNSIILNATGANLNQTVANTFTVAPVRNDVANIAQVMFYNTTSKEVTYGNTISVAGNITGANFIGNLANGNSDVSIPTANGNINFDVAGNANVVVMTGTGANITGTLNVTGNITGNTNGFAIGYLNIPQIAAANATLALTDAGKHYYSTTAGNFTLTVPTNANVAFATGTAVSIVVQAAGNILVNAASGVTLYMAGNSTAANRVVGGYGMATLMKVGTNTWFINGTGVA